jgi:hypothetical protein
MEERNLESAKFSVDAIEEALTAARQRLERAVLERANLDREIANAKEEERLLVRLLELRRNGISGGSEGIDVEGAVGAHREESAPKDKKLAVKAVLAELESAGRPLHISELMRLLRDRNVPIPGSGSQANLITHLRRDARIVRPSRGMYALAISGLENMPTGERRRRKKRRRVRISASQNGGVK